MNSRASRRADTARHHERGARVLYLSHDGMCDPLGASQVLPYLIGLAERGHEISLISFEKPQRGEDERDAVRGVCAAAGIGWHPLPYHRRPPVLSTMVDVRRMWRLAKRLHGSHRFDIVHCRSYVAALVGLRLKRRSGVAFLFDMRGFWADERLEGGGWRRSNPLFRAVYAFFKRRERDYWREADAMVSLTEAGKKVIERANSGLVNQPPIGVIPCCVDFDLFTPGGAQARQAARSELGIGEKEKVLAYVGSLGGNYMLEEMLDFYRIFRERNQESRFLFVTHTPESGLRGNAAAKDIPDKEIVIRAASRPEVPVLLAAADLGIAFKQPSYSALACSPTKLSEMLALEIPVVVNAGVGDVDEIVEETGGGVVVDRFDDRSYRRALDQLSAARPDMKRWRAAARVHFDLETGIDRYDAVYRNLVRTAVGSGKPVR